MVARAISVHRGANPIVRLALACVALLGLAACWPEQPRPRGGTGWLAISSVPSGAFDYEAGNSDIYLIRADGSGRTQLTTAPRNDFSPNWSPDGKRLVFRSTRDGNDELYVMNADGSGQFNLS